MNLGFKESTPGKNTSNNSLWAQQRSVHSSLGNFIYLGTKILIAAFYSWNVRLVTQVVYIYWFNTSIKAHSQIFSPYILKHYVDDFVGASYYLRLVGYAGASVFWGGESTIMKSQHLIIRSVTTTRAPFREKSHAVTFHMSRISIILLLN